MPIALMTQSAFLRRQFARTRHTLLGLPVARKKSKPASESQVEASLASQPLGVPPSQHLQQIAHFPTQQRVLERKQSVVERAGVHSSQSSPLESGEQLGWGRSALRFTLTLVMIVCFSVLGAVILPDLYYRVFSSTPTAYDEVSEAAREYEQPGAEEVVEAEEPYMPDFNPNLPEGAWISIPLIGVYTQLQPTENPDEALDTGVWMVPDFGRPGSQDMPIIAAAHRFGWDWWWQNDYWKYNSFYLLTETEPGDRIEIVYEQRKWIYEIYDGEEGTLISDYDADLILYTCKHLRSPIRHFRYARVVEV
ncbi:MAG: hypothetical protein WDZ94_05055 [Patescibacteria group bacterium]